MRQIQNTLANIMANLLKFRLFYKLFFVHVKAAINFQLQGVDVLAWLAVVKGDIGAGVRAVKFHPIFFGF